MNGTTFGLWKLNKQLEEIGEGTLVLGLRHANNMIKHNFNFIHEHKLVHQTTLPQILTFYAIAEHCWSHAGDEFKGKYPEQKLNYDKYIAGKGILGVCRKVIEFLKEENNKVY
ncbi:hypothetical protein [Psychrobacillus sp. MER TA 171]|uniref:hypothetical protein n=1 Tax=Psychrobacillus sp. MER TA 171 TaxID=2939577 RepID=UPI002041B755|nr:hypothetical protein [Psychrobacillus sp. MER TA 171]MCM3359815.1 hypothetical protein [Psychrobacillus sp. MER TA 171]